MVRRMSVPPLPAHSADIPIAPPSGRGRQPGKAEPEGEPFGDLLSALLKTAETNLPAGDEGEPIAREGDTLAPLSGMVGEQNASTDEQADLAAPLQGSALLQPVSAGIAAFARNTGSSLSEPDGSTDRPASTVAKSQDGFGPAESPASATLPSLHGSAFGKQAIARAEPAVCTSRDEVTKEANISIGGSDIAVAGAFPGNGDGSFERGGHSPALERAERFNEHGFFSGATARGPSASDSVEPPASRIANANRESVTIGFAAPSPEALTGSSSAAPDWLAARGLATGPGASPDWSSDDAVRSERAATVQSPHVAVQARTTPGLGGGLPLGQPRQPEVQPDIVRDEHPAGGAAAQRRLLHLVQEYLEAGGASMAQVTLQAGEQGISLFARVERLSRDERSRLRAEIAQLLAQQGFVAHDIRLNGDAGPALRL